MEHSELGSPFLSFFLGPLNPPPPPPPTIEEYGEAGILFFFPRDIHYIKVLVWKAKDFIYETRINMNYVEVFLWC